MLKKVGFGEGSVGQCLSMKKSEKGVVNTALYADDDLIVGNYEAIDKAITTF